MPAHPHTAVPAAHRKPLGADGPFYHWWITAALMLGFTTAGLSVTVVQLAFPHIMTQPASRPGRHAVGANQLP